MTARVSSWIILYGSTFKFNLSFHHILLRQILILQTQDIYPGFFYSIFMIQFCLFLHAVDSVMSPPPLHMLKF